MPIEIPDWTPFKARPRLKKCTQIPPGYTRCRAWSHPKPRRRATESRSNLFTRSAADFLASMCLRPCLRGWHDQRVTPPATRAWRPACAMAVDDRLSGKLETRKLVERAKGILQRELGMDEETAYLTLQKQCRQRRLSMKKGCRGHSVGRRLETDTQQPAASISGGVDTKSGWSPKWAVRSRGSTTRSRSTESGCCVRRPASLSVVGHHSSTRSADYGGMNTVCRPLPAAHTSDRPPPFEAVAASLGRFGCCCCSVHPYCRWRHRRPFFSSCGKAERAFRTVYLRFDFAWLSRLLLGFASKALCRCSLQISFQKNWRW